ncbi:carboxypeptidase-like regulatory domain-containing protein [Pedobacter sp. B4-66]|uniref:carboxypeptidase-like regulatory domain-containing protein n=1 Tax=Pedobacter sp. B4-66 TaxID=2817280 RepID=UPI001BDA2A8B|nr:carboxypeptidase-like regulatory domain-containing protein [Pedobacter sp. B4-66]
MKRALYIPFFSVVILVLAFIPEDNDPVNKLITSLQKWVETNPQEKVYLHTDKPYYAIGDTIWLKAYVTSGSRHKPSTHSGILYVDLINERDSIQKTLKLQLTKGTSAGDLILADDFKEGNYRLRAYTQWMRNSDKDYFFDRTFIVGDPFLNSIDGKTNSRIAKKGTKEKVSKKAVLKGELSESDVRFFPESGDLINGITSKVAFKAIGVNGAGISIKGKIKDNEGKEIADFSSLYAGMGAFNLKPELGKSYVAEIVYPDGSEKRIMLPKVSDDGYAVSINQDNKDSLSVSIKASSGLYQSAKTVALIVQSSGEVIYSSSIKISKPITSIRLAKGSFPTGIAQFSLFNNEGEPLNERIAFVRSRDLMQLKLKTEKTSYNTKENVWIEMESKDPSGKPVAGNFSVTVINEGKVPSDEASESTILSNLLLSSDLKGYIEKPNYYFINETEETSRALDNLMLTQGYRRFVWKSLGQAFTPVYKTEKSGIEISGKAVTLGNKPLVNAKVNLLSLNGGIMEDTRTYSDGRFKFDDLMFKDGFKFVVQARTHDNRKNVEIILDSALVEGITKNKNLPDVSNGTSTDIKVYLENSRNQDQALPKFGKLSRVQRLREVKIIARKRESEIVASQGMLRIPEGHADQTFFFEKPEVCANLGICLQGRLHGVTFRKVGIVQNYPLSRPNAVDSSSHMQIIVNGRKIEDPMEIAGIFDNNEIDPVDIVKIEVVRVNLALIGILGRSSILIYTKKASLRNKKYIPNVVNFSAKGFDKGREFYEPRYENGDKNNKIPDFRSTIYWNATVKTNNDGKAYFDFYNASEPGIYKVVVEGINAAGELGRSVYRYTVK